MDDDVEQHGSDPGIAALVAQQRRVSEPEMLLSWEAAEYVHYERGRLWYLIGGIAAFLMISYSIFTEAYMSAVAVALLAGVVYLYAHELPSIQRNSISRMGITVGEHFYPFTSIKTFWLVISSDVRQLHFETSGRMAQVLVVQLGEMDPVLLRRTLATELPEAAGREEGLLDRLARILKL